MFKNEQYTDITLTTFIETITTEQRKRIIGVYPEFVQFVQQLTITFR